MHGRYFTLVLIFASRCWPALGGGRIRHPQRAIAAAAVIISALSAGTMFFYRVYHYYGQGPWQVVPKLTSVSVLMQVLGRPADRRCKRPCSRPLLGSCAVRAATVSGVAAQPQTITAERARRAGERAG